MAGKDASKEMIHKQLKRKEARRSEVLEELASIV